VSDYLTLTDEDDGKLFRVRVLNTGEERISRYHRFTLAGRPLKFLCFTDPDRPDDYRRWRSQGLVLIRPVLLAHLPTIMDCLVDAATDNQEEEDQSSANQGGLPSP